MRVIERATDSGLTPVKEGKEGWTSRVSDCSMNSQIFRLAYQEVLGPKSTLDE